MKLFRNYLTTKTLILPNFDINEMVLNIANKINTTFGHFRRMITENYFRANIQECLKRIDYWDSKLSLSQKPDSIIKLKDLMGPKLKEQCFYEFHNIFKYGFKF